jgi:hypothetical protein
MDFKNLWKGKASVIVLIALIINILLVYAIQGTFELSSAITYVLVGLILIGIIKFKSKRFDSAAFFMIGAAIPAIYNGLGHLLGFFSITATFFIVAVLEQGVITWAVAKLHGVK